MAQQAGMPDYSDYLTDKFVKQLKASIPSGKEIEVATQLLNLALTGVAGLSVYVRFAVENTLMFFVPISESHVGVAQLGSKGNLQFFHLFQRGDAPLKTSFGQLGFL